MIKPLFLIVILFLSLSLHAKVKIDSLLSVWNNSTLEDTIRLDALKIIAWDGYLYSYPDSTYYYAQQMIDYATEKGLKKYIATGWNIQGASFASQGDYDKAIIYYEKSLEINEEINDKERIAAAMGNLGIVYKNLGDLPKALDYYQRSLAINQELENKKGIAVVLYNIGIIYKTQKEYEQAMDYYSRAIKIQEEDGNIKEVSSLLNAIGNIYIFKGDTSAALENFYEALAIKDSIGDLKGTALTLINIGNVHHSRREFDKALELFDRSLAIRTKMNDKKGMAMTLGSIGSVYSEQGNSKMAIEYCLKSVALSKNIGLLEQIKNSSKFLYKNYRLLGDTEKALESYETFISLRDSLQNDEIQKELIKQQYQMKADSIRVQQELKDALEEAEQNKKDALAKKESEKKNVLIGVGAIGSVLGIFFTVFIFNRLRLVRRQKSIIENQKVEVEEKNKEITDSIVYAKRIQSAILPPAKLVKEYLQDSFILYKPKDIVAGDFYWMEVVALQENRGSRILFAAADCTGHGVPGAMVSVVCNNGLNRSVREHGLTDPGRILDKTREIVIQEFEKSEDDVKDGMDIALCSLELAVPGSMVLSSSGSENISSEEIEELRTQNLKSGTAAKLQYAGAHNPLWIIRNGANEVEEIKANKQPIGKFENPLPYTTHTLALQKGDAIYIFSDGYADQFGGERGKKFKAKGLKDLLLSIRNKSMEEQRSIIESSFEAWKGEIEQLDDVCIIGVRV